MSSQTTLKLNLPYILPAQAQKHVTHNEALKVLDTLIHLSVVSDVLSQAPANPAAGDRYLVASIGSEACLLYTSPSPRDATLSRMPSSA